ncbi:hypothetical protein M3P05_07895 [Sansalvadorimonas sp. 2012CJ34-2]|uniref:J domain-containing protein n=1 Tax=Parendozoicomonas callyspongiae TaxID=2942213 RepID=A0ABT0PER4_9GAMM|nr:hypothetical protein [Sansalvadorimonas sp. 2012CJ34-2]MCL6269862.1 hypothetical protein [Sansalvadorimonas sp. 2012CJ34-2]
MRSLRKVPPFHSPLIPFTLFATALVIPFLVLVVSGYFFLSVIYLLLMIPWKTQLVRVAHHIYQEFHKEGLEESYRKLDFQPDTFRLATDLVEIELKPGERNIVGTFSKGEHSGKDIGNLDPGKLSALLSHLQDKYPLTCLLINLCIETDFDGALPPPDIEAASTLLGVQPSAGRDAISRNFRRLMMGFHPDRGGSDSLASMIYAAKQVLLDEAA